MAEVRPWVGAYVSVAHLATTRVLRVVNCTTDDRRVLIYRKEPPPAEREAAVWRDIDRSFSEPVSLLDDVAEYAPTQVIAEFFKENGLDGIAYGSALGDGHNVALFDPELAILQTCGLVRIRALKLESSMAANAYFVDAVENADD